MVSKRVREALCIDKERAQVLVGRIEQCQSHAGIHMSTQIVYGRALPVIGQ